MLQSKTKTMSSIDDDNSNSHVSQLDNLDDFQDDKEKNKIIDDVETGLKQLERQYKFQLKNKNVSFQLLEKKEGPYKIQIKIEEDRKYIMKSIVFNYITNDGSCN